MSWELCMQNFNTPFCHKIVLIPSILIFFSLLAVTPPKITWHPENQSVAFGEHVVFSIKATGENLQFQWQKNGSDLSDDDNYYGVNTDTLDIVAVKEDDEGDYGCLVKNDVGKLVSDAALLTLGKLLSTCYLPM